MFPEWVFNNFQLRRIVVLIFYLTLGLVNSLYRYAAKRDLQSFGMSISTMNAMLLISHLPWQLKFISAIFCDVVPLCGRHRKPYIVLSNSFALVCVVLLALSPTDPNAYVALLFFKNYFITVADVNYDACLVEIGRGEGTNKRGAYQTIAWSVRFTGDAVGEISGPLIWLHYGSSGVFKCIAITLSVAVFVSFFLADVRDSTTISEIYDPNGKQQDFQLGPDLDPGGIQIHESPQGLPYEKPHSFKKFGVRHSIKLIFKTVTHPFIRWILFYHLFTSLFPTTGLAMFFYVTNELHFRPEQMSLLSLLSALAKLLGMGAYRFLRGYSIQSVYVFTSIISILVGLTTYIVSVRFSNGMTLAEFYGFDNFWCAITDDVIGEALDTIRSMSLLIATGIVCELAVEAGAYSTVLSLLNAFNAARVAIEGGIMDALHINNGSFGQLPLMATIGICMRIVALVLVFPVVPDTSVNEIADDHEHDTKHRAEAEEIEKNRKRENKAKAATATTAKEETTNSASPLEPETYSV